ncbi:MAG: dCTP deaminase [Thermoleophilia bacterium]
MSTQQLRNRLRCEGDEGIIITPMIDEDNQISDYGSIDLRLGREFETTVLSSHPYTSPIKKINDGHERRPARVYLTSLIDPYVIHPQEFVKAKTLEYVKLPTDIGARLSGRSSWAREGLLVHCTADVIHPGSANYIVMELRNIGSVPIELYAGLRVAQLTFFRLEENEVKENNGNGQKDRGNLSEYLGKFTSIDTPYTGLLEEDIEAKILSKVWNADQKKRKLDQEYVVSG